MFGEFLREDERNDFSFFLAPHFCAFGHAIVKECYRIGVLLGVVVPPPFEHPLLSLITPGDDSFASDVVSVVPLEEIALFFH